MLAERTPHRVALPAVPVPVPRAPFPFVATAAPVLVSLGIWAVTGSIYSLLFAALGPVVAGGSLLDGRGQRRRAARRDTELALAAVDGVRRRVLDLHERERQLLGRTAPALSEFCEPARALANWSRVVGDGDAQDAAPVPLRIGRADRAGVVVVDDGPPGGTADHDLPSTLRAAIAEVRRAAAVLADAPWLVDARDGVGIVGPPAAARALARSLVLQLAASCSPQSTRIVVAAPMPVEAEWLLALPHPVELTRDDGAGELFRVICTGAELLVACASERSRLPPGVGTVVDLLTQEADDRPRHPQFEVVSAARALDIASALAARAEQGGLLPAMRRLPNAVSLAEVLSMSDRAAPDSARDRPGLRAPIGCDAAGVVELDLVRDGSHAVVAGTTGAGKSELLISWVLAMAARHPPSAVTFLLVDFKGGAAFAPLAGLPHVIGVVSDLDARGSSRAIESLRAELLRRERLLAARGVRSIDELEPENAAVGTGLARLVIVVDEFAAVVSGQPELHELFADLSARGRSLGLHLILCTQRPSGVVRDAVLANVTLRISLRVTDRGDSLAMIGTDAASRLPVAPAGRALILDGGGTTREVQLARTEPGDADRLAAAGPPPSERMWCEPLPTTIPLGSLLLDGRDRDREAALANGIPFGRLDLPAEQRQPVARHDPRVDGHLLVLGAAGAGRTTVLSTLAEGAATVGGGCRVVPDDPAEAWSVLTELLDRPEADRSQLLLLDDLDLLLDRLDPDTRHDLIELLSRVMRGARGRSLVVTAQRLSGGLQALAGLFDARLLLRQTSRDEHVLSGGDGAAFDPRLPAGAGRWTGPRGGGAEIQVAIGTAPLPAPAAIDLPVLGPAPGRPLAVVCPRPGELARTLGPTNVRVVVVGDDPIPDEQNLRQPLGAAPLVLLGDPDAWQAEWSALTLIRREFAFAVVGCGPAELRAVARTREAVPPLGRRSGECWWVEAGTVMRAVLDLGVPRSTT